MTTTHRLFAIPVATLMLSGCVCEDGMWKDGRWLASFDAAEAVEPAPNCEIVRVARFSKSSAAIAERADPILLETARLEAERDCYKAAEAKLRQRLDTLKNSG